MSHGDAIHHLGLPEGVVDDLSLRQIRCEARPWGFSRQWASDEDEDYDDDDDDDEE